MKDCWMCISKKRIRQTLEEKEIWKEKENYFFKSDKERNLWSECGLSREKNCIWLRSWSSRKYSSIISKSQLTPFCRREGQIGFQLEAGRATYMMTSLRFEADRDFSFRPKWTTTTCHFDINMHHQDESRPHNNKNAFRSFISYAFSVYLQLQFLIWVLQLRGNLDNHWIIEIVSIRMAIHYVFWDVCMDFRGFIQFLQIKLRSLTNIRFSHTVYSHKRNIIRNIFRTWCENKSRKLQQQKIKEVKEKKTSVILFIMYL